MNFNANFLGKACLLCYNGYGDNYSLIAFEDHSTEGGQLKHTTGEVIGLSKALTIIL